MHTRDVCQTIYNMELIGIFILVIPFVIGFLVGKQVGIKEEQDRR